MRHLLAVALGLAFLAVSVLGATAHPGKTDAYGCHEGKRPGEYHCH